MKAIPAAVGSATFFVVAPGTVLGIIPWLITRWKLPDVGPGGQILQGVGVVLIGAGLVLLVDVFVQFVKAGGTPAPIAPTQQLVVTGFNRFVRNPIYVAVLVVVLGQALLFGSLGLAAYAAGMWVLTASFVYVYEDPTLVRQFGREYEAYRRNVRAWIPRLHPWAPFSITTGAERWPPRTQPNHLRRCGHADRTPHQ
jgi:protein-S-isoprenylcysteine O-methyltransferase Ste14